MKKHKVEYIKHPSSNKKCYICDGSGKVKKIKCGVCNGTGIFEDNHYILVTNGMAFQVDTFK